MQIVTSPFEALSVFTLHDMLRLRSDVFVVEQKCVYADIDGADALPDTLHVLGRIEERLVAAARVLGLSSEGPVRIGRVVVHPDYRRRGFARMILLRCLDEIKSRQAAAVVMLGAQVFAVSLYTSVGFECVSEPYDEDGIEHVDMRLALGAGDALENGGATCVTE